MVSGAILQSRDIWMCDFFEYATPVSLYCSSKWSTCSHQRTVTFCIKIYATCFWRKKDETRHTCYCQRMTGSDFLCQPLPCFTSSYGQASGQFIRSTEKLSSKQSTMSQDALENKAALLRTISVLYWENFHENKATYPTMPCFAQDYIHLFVDHTHIISTIVCTSCPSWHSLQHSEWRERLGSPHLFFQVFHSIPSPPKQ